MRDIDTMIGLVAEGYDPEDVIDEFEEDLVIEDALGVEFFNPYDMEWQTIAEVDDDYLDEIDEWDWREAEMLEYSGDKVEIKPGKPSIHTRLARHGITPRMTHGAAKAAGAAAVGYGAYRGIKHLIKKRRAKKAAAATAAAAPQTAGYDDFEEDYFDEDDMQEGAKWEKFKAGAKKVGAGAKRVGKAAWAHKKKIGAGLALAGTIGHGVKHRETYKALASKEGREAAKELYKQHRAGGAGRLRAAKRVFYGGYK